MCVRDQHCGSLVPKPQGGRLCQRRNSGPLACLLWRCTSGLYHLNWVKTWLSLRRDSVKMSQKKCGPGQTRRLTGTALGRVIVTGGLIKRRRTLAMLCYAAVTVALIHRPYAASPRFRDLGQKRGRARSSVKRARDPSVQHAGAIPRPADSGSGRDCRRRAATGSSRHWRDRRCDGQGRSPAYS